MSWNVFVVEGGPLDGCVVLRDQEGSLLRLSVERDAFVALDDEDKQIIVGSCLLKMSDADHSYNDAATIGLFLGERERLIRAVASLSKKTGVPDVVVWYGTHVADTFPNGRFVRVAKSTRV